MKKALLDLTELVQTSSEKIRDKMELEREGGYCFIRGFVSESDSFLGGRIMN